MQCQRIVRPDGRVTWTLLNADGGVNAAGDDFAIHLAATDESPNTIRAYMRAVAVLGTWLEQDGLRFQDMTVRHMDRFVSWLQGAATTGPTVLLLRDDIDPAEPRFAPRSINQIHSALKRFYHMLDLYEQSGIDLAVTQGRKPWDNPYRGFLWHIERRKAVRKSKRRQKGVVTAPTPRLSPEQVLALINACRCMRDVLLIVILYNSGLRIGEALGLRHSDIDHGSKLISVYKRRDNENGARAKSERPRHIPVNPYVVNMYEDYLVSEEYRPSFEAGSDYLFTNIEEGAIGRALTYETALDLCRRLRRRVGFHWTWHWLRHTHISECIAQGYSLLEAAERAGHSDIQVTNDFYKHLFDHEYKRRYLKSDGLVRDRLRQMEEERRARGA